MSWSISVCKASFSMLCFLLLSSLVLASNPLSTRASGGTVGVWLTTADLSTHLAPQASLTFANGSGSDPTTITVNEKKIYQQMVGFGASFTDASTWLVYNKMSQRQRNQLMTNLFDPKKGIGLSFLRQPMGSTDFSQTEYTYDDVPAGQADPNLSHFSIAPDTAYNIPILKQVLKLNPKAKIMASPWTAPAWMKSNDSLEQGSLNASAFHAYANYFVDFVKAYQAQGIPIYAVTPQNEPGNNNRMPTMPMSADDETNFIANDLGPAFAHNGIKTLILGYDHNWDNPSYPTTILSSSTASSYVSGTAWHCYGGTPDVMTSFHNSFPKKGIYETECSGGSWEGPKGFQKTTELMINSARNWAKTVVRWVPVLDPNGNPHLSTPDSCNGCRGVVSVDQNSGNVTYNADYYALGQASKFVIPGAYHIDSSAGDNGISNVAFKNPDGTKVLVVYNSSSTSQTFAVQWGQQSFSYTLPAGAVATFKWSGTQVLLSPSPS